MSTASPLLAAATTAVLATSSIGLTSSPAKAALLIEGVLSGKRLRLVVDVDRGQADVTHGDKRHVLDLEAAKAHRIEADGTRRKADLAPNEAGPKPSIRPWGPGPAIAGHASVYHVMKVDGQICGELLISPWMKPFVDPAVQALALLERVKGEGGLAPVDLDGACGDLKFSSYTAAGWPLMAGSIDRPIFRTETISFDYRPRADEFASSD